MSEYVQQAEVGSPPDSRQFSVYLPVGCLQVVDEIARRRLTSRAAVIREWIADGVRREQVA